MKYSPLEDEKKSKQASDITKIDPTTAAIAAGGLVLTTALTTAIVKDFRLQDLLNFVKRVFGTEAQLQEGMDAAEKRLEELRKNSPEEFHDAIDHKLQLN